MKRNDNLYHLSWQHHNGLMAVLLLKKGIAKKADPVIMADFISQVRNDELDGHFEAEENVLIAFGEKYPALKPLIEKMLSDHKAIRTCYTELNTPSFTFIEKFYQLLEQHIRFEERELFPLLEETILPEELKTAGEKLQHLPHQSCINFPVKFWE
jgi:hemerythrin-like domain-containing protein